MEAPENATPKSATKKRIGFFLVLAILGAMIAVFVTTRPREQIVFIGPHKTPIKFVPFDEANRKPWFNFHLPLVGQVTYPRTTPVRGVDPRDDPRFVAGYLLIDADYARLNAGERFPMFNSSRFSPAMSALSPTPTGGKQTAVPIPYPRTPEDAKEPLELIILPGFERVEITRKFDPSRLPAKYGQSTFTVGDLQLSAYLSSYRDANPILRVQVQTTKAPGGTIQYESTAIGTSLRSHMSGPFPMVMDIPGVINRDGSITAEGAFGYSLNSNKVNPPNALKIVLKPK